MSTLTAASGLGKGSLYNFFPGGKDEIASAVLDDITQWFDTRVFAPLRAVRAEGRDPLVALDEMLGSVDDYFRSGRRACLPGSFALSTTRDRFSVAIASYFAQWIDALTEALAATGLRGARAHAVQLIAGVQGGIVLARALDDHELFQVALRRERDDLVAALAKHEAR